jgi:hypothetical protein
VPRASTPFLIFCAPKTRFRWYRGRPDSFFSCAEGVGSCFHVLRSLTSFQRYRGIQLPFSSFACPNSFSAVPTASGPVFMFCATEHVFGGAEGDGSRFHVLLPDSFSAASGVSGSLFQVLLYRTHFRRYRVRDIPFSCFELPDSFSAVPTASGPIFLFCTPGLVFGDTEGVGSGFHVLRLRSCFRRYRGRRLPFSGFARLRLVFGAPFSCFSLPTRFRRYRVRDIPFHVLRTRTHFRRVPRASGPVFLFCTPESFSAIPRASGLVFMFCASGVVFGATEGVDSRFHVLRALTCFLWYRGHQVPFSCFAFPDMFSAVRRA